jgi:chain length determinant protein tyrosine kinase EpsG
MGANERVERSIGSVLVDAGRLRAEDTELILRVQRERGLRFGEAGLSLGLITPRDIDFALSQQFEYAYLQPGGSPVSEEVFAAYAPFSREAEALRVLRAQLMVRWFDDGPARSSLAIISAAPGEGRSYVAANLAVTFSQAGERTLLIDADMRNPRQHRLFGVENRIGLSAVLALRSNGESIQRVPGLPHLALLPAGAIPPNPHELVMRPVFVDLLQQLGAHYDVILLDSPPATQAADAQTLAVRAGAALMVVRKNKSRAAEVRAVREVIPEAAIVGAVLNDF